MPEAKIRWLISDAPNFTNCSLAIQEVLDSISAWRSPAEKKKTMAEDSTMGDSSMWRPGRKQPVLFAPGTPYVSAGSVQ